MWHHFWRRRYFLTAFTFSFPGPRFAVRSSGQSAIVIDIKDEDYGGRGFSCRDLEGHLWNFDTYDPSEAKEA